MTRWPCILIAALCVPAHLALADDEPPTPPPAPAVMPSASFSDEAVLVSGAASGTRVSEDYLVIPDGAILGASLRAITADGGLGSGALKLTDLALFDAHLEWAIAHGYELDATVSVLAKQPSSTREDVFQGGALTLQHEVGAATAILLGGSARPLVGFGGAAYGGSWFVQHKKRLDEIVAFTMGLGADVLALAPTGMPVGETAPLLAEVAAHGAVLVRVPNGVWGGWLGASYALPAYHRGDDPVSGMAFDPQPRLDLDLGTGVELGKDWYLTADLAVIDRGDLSNPATRLPILDGGFDQVQITVGVTRRVHGEGHDRERGDALQDSVIPL